MITKEEIIKKEIISTAQQLFQHYGFAKTTMEDIAKAMKKGKSTLYYYFKSKEEIFEAVAISEGNDVISNVHKAINEVKTAEEKLRIYLQTTITIVKTKINLYGLMKEEALESDNCQSVNPFKDPIRLFNSSENKVVQDILMIGIQNGEFNKKLKEDVELVSYVIITALRSIIIDLAFSKNNISNRKFFEEEKLKTMSDILIKGLKE